jgi:hypothetical protein
MPSRMPDRTGLYASFPGGIASLRKLTLRGAVLEDRDPLPIGTRLLLALHLGAPTVRCVGIVKRFILEEGMVVEFVDMSATDRRRLLEYIVAAERSLPLPPFAEPLVRRGVMTPDQLAVAAAEHRERGGRFCAVLLRLGLVSDSALAKYFSEEYGIPLIDVTTVEPTLEALQLVPCELAERHEILPIGVTPSTLTVATSDPSNLEGRNEVQFHASRDLTVGVAPSRLLREAVHYVYHERAFVIPPRRGAPPRVTHRSQPRHHGLLS